MKFKKGDIIKREGGKEEVFEKYAKCEYQGDYICGLCSGHIITDINSLADGCGWRGGRGLYTLVKKASRSPIPAPKPKPRRVANAEKLAKLFHDTYERLAPAFGWNTKKRCKVAFADLPERNRKLMIATCQALCAYFGRAGNMKRGEIETAVRRAYNLFDEWNDVTGFPAKHTSYYFEIQSLIEDAVHCGIQAALKIKEPIGSEKERA